MFTTKFLVSSYITITICILGILGNLFCVLVLFNKRTSPGPYLFLLQGLTISDTCVLTLSLIRGLRGLHLFTVDFIPGWSMTDFLWDWIATLSTKYFTVAISLERFIFVNYPLQASQYMTLRRSRYFTISVWLVCVCISAFSFVYNEWLDPTHYSFDLYAAIIVHFLPFVLVFIFNLLVFWALRGHSKKRKEIKTSDKGKYKDDSSVNRMLMGVTVIFGVCYSFEMVRRIMNYGWKDYMSGHEYYDYTINVLADIFYVLNSSVNFIIYCLLGRSFRRVFVAVSRQIFCGKEEKYGSSSTSNASSEHSKALTISKESELNQIQGYVGK